MEDEKVLFEMGDEMDPLIFTHQPPHSFILPYTCTKRGYMGFSGVLGHEFVGVGKLVDIVDFNLILYLVLSLILKYGPETHLWWSNIYIF